MSATSSSHRMHLNGNDKVKNRARRSSSVGKIDLGDTVHSLTSMSSSSDAKKQRQANLKQNIGLQSNGIWSTIYQFCAVHLWVVPLIFITVIYTIYFNCEDRSEKNPLHMFVNISYQIGDSNRYSKGIKDIFFVFYYMIVFTFIREFFMDMIIRPWALMINIKSEHKLKRLMEQVFYVIYYGFSSPFGLWIMYNSDLWLFRTDTMYKTYPDFNNEFYFKWFYLGQSAFWTQQACVLVLQLEKPRKDYYELVFHHIVTLLLIWSSYVFHFTKMGLAVYITMDVSDWFLAFSKSLNYVDSVATPVTFLSFIFAWIYLRHFVNIKILWSVLTEFRTEGPYVLNFATQQYKCWISQGIVFTLIFALQLVNLYWLFLILRILYRFLFSGVATDDRSDNSSIDD